MTAGPLALLAAGAAGTALLLVLPAPAPGSLPRPGERRTGPGRGAPSRLVAGAVPVAAAAAVLWLDGTRLALALVLLGIAAGVATLVRRHRRARHRARTQARVVELGETLVGELRAGRPVGEALQRACRAWPPFGAVAASSRIGADVPAALRDLARMPGAEGLGRLASAWRVSERTGCSLVGVLEQVATSVRAEAAAERLVRAELSSAQATARLVAVLPVATLTMASGTGADPWRFLLATPAGLACLAVGAGLVLAGLWWIELIAAAVTAP